MRPALSIAVITFLALASLLPALTATEGSWQHEALEREGMYDGKWWLSTDPEEQNGFLNGAADCLTWVAHKKWVSHSIAWAIPRINEYYKTHEKSSAESVIEVWHSVLSKAPPDIDSPAAETWSDPHGYFDGGYWREGSNSEHKGFVEGYLSCLRTQGPSPSQSYSRSISYYVREIDQYVKTHPDSYREAIANILAHFRDRPNKY
jgi:hypothetical protein